MQKYKIQAKVYFKEGIAYDVGSVIENSVGY
jgi:hypothetical protein